MMVTGQIYEEYVEYLFWVKLCLQGCDLENRGEPQQEVVCLSYLALAIRHSDLVLDTCCSEGQEERILQEAAVREKAGAAFICVSVGHCHSGEERGQRGGRWAGKRTLSLVRTSVNTHAHSGGLRHWSSVSLVSELVCKQEVACISEHTQLKSPNLETHSHTTVVF